MENLRKEIQVKNESGRSVSIWMSQDLPAAPLIAGAHADVCIVGAGIAGVTTAYCLLREGNSVILLDAGQPGGGMTQRTTAHLSNAIDDRYVEVERLHGKNGAKLAAQSHTAAIDWIDNIRLQERIECDFMRVTGYLFAPSDDDRDVIDEEWQAAKGPAYLGSSDSTACPGTCLGADPACGFPDRPNFIP